MYFALFIHEIIIMNNDERNMDGIHVHMKHVVHIYTHVYVCRCRHMWQRSVHAKVLSIFIPFFALLWLLSSSSTKNETNINIIFNVVAVMLDEKIRAHIHLLIRFVLWKRGRETV